MKSLLESLSVNEDLSPKLDEFFDVPKGAEVMSVDTKGGAQASFNTMKQIEDIIGDEYDSSKLSKVGDSFITKSGYIIIRIK